MKNLINGDKVKVIFENKAVPVGTILTFKTYSEDKEVINQSLGEVYFNAYELVNTNFLIGISKCIKAESVLVEEFTKGNVVSRDFRARRLKKEVTL